jgi:predicted site-specific integrase-resolvase
MTSNLIGSAEVATRLGVDRATLSRWVKAGRLEPVVQLPGRTGAMLFDPADVARLARQKDAA